MYTIIENLPAHLRKYVVEQTYEKYTSEDQAVWRYIMLQLKSFLSQHAHDCYLEGLEKTGITTGRIPRIEDINQKLAVFGWGAVPVSGFIPPAAFMEFQSLGVLPIASDMRSIDHILYTPAPDIVHEAAGHAPILIHSEFATYLKKYAEIARKAIISKEDMDQYEAIRVLSDVKENPDSTPEEIASAEQRLSEVSAAITEVSEAGWLSRMNWWTAEYGLIGSLEAPKIFGAGLLSSVGESRECLSDTVKKIPLTVDCVNTGYDITEPQPQLFVTPDFEHLHSVLDDLADMLAFRKGGSYGLEKAKSARTINSVELETGLQVSGVLERYDLSENGQPVFFKMSGPTQLSAGGRQLPGHGPEYHSHGYSSPLGSFNGWNGDIKTLNLKSLGVSQGETVRLTFDSGILVHGKVESITEFNGTPLIIQFSACTVQKGDDTLFAPDWGLFDMALGTKVSSVFGGAADRTQFENTEDFVAAKVPLRIFSESDRSRFEIFDEIRKARENQQLTSDIIQQLIDRWSNSSDKNWLVGLEIVELAKIAGYSQDLTEEITQAVESLYDKQTLQHYQGGLQLLNETDTNNE